jgi:hypothetical protein
MNVERFPVVGFIPRLKPMGFRLATAVNDEIVIKRPTDNERLAEGYRERAERSRQLAEGMDPASLEATDQLGEAPDWSE